MNDDCSFRCGGIKDLRGKVSRKAIAGFPCIFVYICLLIYIIVCNISISLTKYYLLTNLLYVGGGLLGLSIFEWFKYDKYKKN